MQVSTVLLKLCPHPLSHLDMGKNYQCLKACLVLHGEIHARWGRSCRDPRESQFNGVLAPVFPGRMEIQEIGSKAIRRKNFPQQ